jgi:hypothetical protein
MTSAFSVRFRSHPLLRVVRARATEEGAAVWRPVRLGATSHGWPWWAGFGRASSAAPVGLRSVCACARYAVAATSSSRLLVRVVSTGTPGPMLWARVMDLRYRPLAAAGLTRTISSTTAW